jgi:hypothetical protein
MVNTYRRFGKKRSEEDYKKKSMPTHKWNRIREHKRKPFKEGLW